jgi:hypothetical protein
MALVSVFSEQVTRQNSVNTGVTFSAGSLWFVQVGGISNGRFTQLGVASLRSVDDLGIGQNCEFASQILYAGVTGMTYNLPDQIPEAVLWLYVSKACPIPDPVMTVYIIG